MNKEKRQMIDNLIMKYGSSAKDIILQGLNIEKKGTNSYRCPNIHSHKNGDNNPSMGWVEDKFYFNCMGCGHTINIYTYFTRYLNYTFNDVMMEEGIEGLLETRQKFKNNVDSEKGKLKQNQIEYLAKRGLKPETIKFFKLADMSGAIGMPYYKNGQLIGVKKRMLEGKIKNLNVTGSKPFLYNCDNVDITEPLIITEGEIDAMIVWQSGFSNVVSVGCGANAVKSLLEQSRDFLNKFPSLVLFTDNDEYGYNMDKVFLEEFSGRVATVDKRLYEGLKDANDIYLKYGELQIKKIIQSGTVSFDGEWDLDNDPYTGLDAGDTKFIATGLETIDYAINTIQSKAVTLITGRSNSGKSTFVNQILVSAIDNGFKAYLVAGEGEKTKIANKFYTSIIGYNEDYYDVKRFGVRDVKEPKQDVLRAIQEWHKNKFKMFVKSLSEYKNEEQLFQMLEYKIRSERYDIIILDNLMSLLTVNRAEDKNESQAKFIEKCHHLAKSTNCAIVVVLHPNKTYRKGEQMDFEQISGTSDIPNKADVILNVIRVDKENSENGETAKIQVAKNRDFPELPTVPCFFNIATSFYQEIDAETNKAKGKIFKGWRKYYKENPKVKPMQEIITEIPF